MTKYREYRYCHFIKKKVPFSVKTDLENKQLTVRYLSCEHAPHCPNTDCKWNPQEANTAHKDFILMD